MANLRVWHQSRDAYHAAFRMLQILHARSDGECNLTKLYILDFFILFPNLLHKISLPRVGPDLKAEFRELHLIRPEDQFLEYPSLPSLFRSIGGYQKAAVKQLTAKGILVASEIREGIASLNKDALSDELAKYLNQKTERDASLFNLIANGIGELPLEGPKGIYHYTRLPRRL